MSNLFGKTNFQLREPFGVNLFDLEIYRVASLLVKVRNSQFDTVYFLEEQD